MAVNEELSEIDPVDEAAEEFVERYRRGERPSVSEYVRRYPTLAGKIRSLFPALVVMEELGPVPSAPALPPADKNAAIPEQLGDYHIVREIARGGMGIVYEAVQQSLGRHVALKVLPFQGGADSSHLERFRREARAAACLHHTNIVPVFGVGEHQGIHYFAMQFIQGQSLDHVLDEVKRLRNEEKRDGGERTLATAVAGNLLSGQFASTGSATDKPAGKECATGPRLAASDAASLNPAAAPHVPNSSGSTSTILNQSAGAYYRSVAQIGLQVAEALEYAHQQKVLHRDIKPSNLLLDTKGTVWVTDFGLAKAEGADDLTRQGDIVGTLRYMAPERFQGRADVRSDIYSLGLTLHEMVTLRPAFGFSEKAQLLESILHQEPPRPRRSDPRVPRDLETIILKAIAKEPGQRYGSAAEMADDLRRFLADRPVQARRTRVLERTWRMCRRNPLVASLVGAVAALLVVVAIGASISAWNLRQEEEATRDQLLLTQKAEQEGRRRLFRSLLEQARASRLSGRMGRRFHSLEILDEAARIARELNLPDQNFLELRNETIACLALHDLRIAKEWPGLPDATGNVHFDRDFQVYARGDRSGDISVRRVAGDAEILHFPSGLEWPGVRLSPDGGYLAAWEMRGRRLKVWKLADPVPEPLFDEPSEHLYDFSTAGAQLAHGRSSGSVELVDLLSGRRKLFKVAPSMLGVTFHPTKQQLAIAYRERVQILDLETESIAGVIPGGDMDWQVAWHPDGRTLATTARDKNLYLWDVASGKQLARLEGHKHIGLQMKYDPSGDLLASRSWDGTLRLWDSRTGRALFATPSVWHHYFHFSGDGRLLGPDLDMEKGTLKLWEVAVPLGYRTLVRDPVWGKEQYDQFAISPRGRLLAAGMADGVALFDLISGRPLRFLPIGQAGLVLFQRSGDLLVGRPDGVYRLSVGEESATMETLHVSALQKLPVPAPTGLAASPDGRVVVVGSGRQAHVWHSDRPDPPIRLEHDDVRSVAVSPDGNWVATGSHGASLETRVWDASTGQLVKSLPGGGFNQVGFSPDGQWLVTTGRGVRLWKVSSWGEGPHVGGIVFTFSADSKVLAVASRSGAVRLLDPATGGEFARLEDPEQDGAYWLEFSPDGTKLVVNGEAQALHVWDLRTIGQQLAQRKLPWNLPLPPANELLPTTPKRLPGETAVPLRVTLDASVLAMTDLVNRASAQSRQGHWDTALWLYSLAMELDPKNAAAHNGLAWLRATCPHARYQDPAQAVRLAEKAVALAPQDGNIWNTLGVAHYRTGNWPAAIGALGQSMKLRQGGNSYDWFFLAMAHWKQGDKESAQAWYARAVLWMTRQAAQNQELLRFRTEAADLLGVVIPPDLPATNDELAYYTFFLDLVPDAAWAYHGRALAYCARGLWDKAAPDFTELLRLSPEKIEFWCEHASVLLLKEDHEGYRGVCRAVLKRFGDSQDHVEQYLLARILALAPHDAARPAEAVERARTATARSQGGSFPHTLALAHYRAGQFADALEQAGKSLDDKAWGAQVVNWLLLAMIHEKLDHRQDALQWLTKATKWLDQARAKTTPPETLRLPVPSWCDTLEVELLRREAQALVKRVDPIKFKG
jgi:serine/threonine protein kinase/WD40 repeat protein/tetratricopeptide (TPR) repeat protein